MNRFEANVGLEGLLQRAKFVGCERYALNKRLLRDPHSRRLFYHHRPGLCALQARVLDELRTQGISMTSLEELFGESARQQWKEIIAIADRFLARELAGVTDGDELQPAVRIDDPLFRLGIAPVVLDVVNSFYGLWSKLKQFDIASFPNSDPSALESETSSGIGISGSRSRCSSTRRTSTKETEGIEYIPESRRGGRYANLCPLPRGSGPDGYLQIPETLVEERVVKADRVVCSAPRGRWCSATPPGCIVADLLLPIPG